MDFTDFLSAKGRIPASNESYVETIRPALQALASAAHATRTFYSSGAK